MLNVLDQSQHTTPANQSGGGRRGFIETGTKQIVTDRLGRAPTMENMNIQA